MGGIGGRCQSYLIKLCQNGNIFRLLHFQAAQGPEVQFLEMLEMGRHISKLLLITAEKIIQCPGYI